MISAYLMHLLVLFCIYSILTLSLNLALGYTGLLNLGHIAFFAIGAYTSALLVKELSMPFLVAFFLAGVLASIFGFLLVFATRKLKGDYLALATLSFSFVVYSVLINWQSLTRGPLGLPGIPQPVLFGFALSTPGLYFLLAFACLALVFLFLSRLVQSSFGRLLEATRDDELGLRILGKDTTKLKYKAMMFSAFFAGIAGSLFAHYVRYIDPKSFMLSELILLLTMLIVGGIASLRGSVLATGIILLIPELLRFLTLPSAILGPARQIVYALILLLILFYKPRGLLGKVDLP